MGARLTVLGSGTAVPNPARAPAGYLLAVGGERLLLDTGSGTLRRLAEAGVGPNEVDRIFYTHYHLDHVLELPLLLFVLRHPGLDRPRELRLYGPPGLVRLARGFEELFGSWVIPRRVRVQREEITPGWCGRFPWGTVRTAATRHVPGSLAYRFDLAGGGSLVYTGDTGPAPGLERFAAAVDLLVAECSLVTAGPGATHLDPRRAGELAAAARARRLVLSHFYPPVEQMDVLGAVRAVYDGPVHLAADLAVFEVP